MPPRCINCKQDLLSFAAGLDRPAGENMGGLAGLFRLTTPGAKEYNIHDIAQNILQKR